MKKQYHTSAQKSTQNSIVYLTKAHPNSKSHPVLHPLARIALEKYLEALIDLPDKDRRTSSLVDCLNVILDADREMRG
jgi:hypothetical protein